MKNEQIEKRRPHVKPLSIIKADTRSLDFSSCGHLIKSAVGSWASDTLRILTATSLTAGNQSSDAVSAKNQIAKTQHVARI